VPAVAHTLSGVIAPSLSGPTSFFQHGEPIIACLSSGRPCSPSRPETNQRTSRSRWAHNPAVYVALISSLSHGLVLAIWSQTRLMSHDKLVLPPCSLSGDRLGNLRCGDLSGLDGPMTRSCSATLDNRNIVSPLRLRISFPRLPPPQDLLPYLCTAVGTTWLIANWPCRFYARRMHLSHRSYVHRVVGAPPPSPPLIASHHSATRSTMHHTRYNGGTVDFIWSLGREELAVWVSSSPVCKASFSQ
jgi:hypothetical protein